jgi:CheY-like chemotaxis protein
LILIDLYLPDMPGETLAAKILSTDGPNAGSQLIAFTAADLHGEALPPAFDGYLGKPIDPHRLAALVHSACQRLRVA